MDHVKPIFLSNPHPSLNTVTGRKLSRFAGGPLASQDHYEGQTWKEHPGVEYLVSWCVRHIQVRVCFTSFSLPLMNPIRHSLPIMRSYGI